MRRVLLTEQGIVRTALGLGLRVVFQHSDKSVMSFAELWAAFHDHYPGRWGVQVLPPTRYALDGANKYWLCVFTTPPKGLDLFDPQEPTPQKSE